MHPKASNQGTIDWVIWGLARNSPSHTNPSNQTDMNWLIYGALPGITQNVFGVPAGSTKTLFLRPCRANENLVWGPIAVPSLSLSLYRPERLWARADIARPEASKPRVARLIRRGPGQTPKSNLCISSTELTCISELYSHCHARATPCVASPALSPDATRSHSSIDRYELTDDEGHVHIMLGLQGPRS